MTTNDTAATTPPATQDAGTEPASTEDPCADREVDQADDVAGYRSVVDDEDVADLPDADPNVAAGGPGPYDAAADQVGDPVDDDHGVAAADDPNPGF